MRKLKQHYTQEELEEQEKIKKAIEITDREIKRNIKRNIKRDIKEPDNSIYDNAITRRYEWLIKHGIH